MKRSTMIITTVVVLILAGIGYWRWTTRAVAVGSYDDFAKCLTEKGVAMYGSFQCHYCKTQKEMFGSSIKYVNYIECGPFNGPLNKQCIDAGITAYPTWIVNGKVYTGEKTIQELSSLSGCQLS